MQRDTGTSIKGLGIETELRLKEQAMDEAPVGITISDPDREGNPLIYVNDRFEEITGYPRDEVLGRNCRFLQGPESDPAAVAQMRDAIDAGETVAVELINYRKNGETFWNQVRIAPIRDESGRITNFVGFQSDVTERKQAEFQVKRERENLEHLVERINGLIGDVTQALVEATSREAVETTVGQRLTADDAYEMAWIGSIDVAGDQLTINQTFGHDQTSEGPMEFDVAGGEDPIARALAAGELQLESDLTGMPADGPARAVDGAFDAMAAVPLVYRDTTYGVLAVYTTSESILDARESVVLSAIGRAVATTLHALESRRILSADSIVEIELELTNPDLFFTTLSANADCAVEFTGSVHQADGSLLMFFSAGTDSETVLSIAESFSPADVNVIAEHDGKTMFEYAAPATSVVGLLAEQGAQTRAITATDGTARIKIELPPGTNARRVVERLQADYPSVELASYRELERPPTTKQEFIAELEDRLTNQQLTALQKAYASGYFEWKRPVSGSELAESMDISRSTYHQHLRAAQRKLVEEFFER